jgi:uncharacterized phage protein (TIGR02218 family)
MAYEDVEILEFFEPRELYKFTRGTFSWFFTTGDTDITFGGDLYLAVPMKRKQIESTQELGKTPLKILCDRTNPFVTQYISESPTDVITLEIIRQHVEDIETVTSFKGRVINVGFKEDEVTITCQSNQSSLLRPGLRRLYQTACPHVLYGDQCTVAKASFKITAVLTEVDGNVLTSPTFTVGIDPTYDVQWFVGGVVEFVDGDGLTNQRFITAHNHIEGRITLNLPLKDAIVSSSVDAFPGCGHDPKTCNEKFTNIESYGGFPFIPMKNPQNGTPVF